MALPISGLSDLCRICLGKIENIHPVNEIERNVLDILTFSLNFKVMETFTFIPNLCEKCKENLDGFSELIKTARETQHNLETWCKTEIGESSEPREETSGNERPPAPEFTYDNVMLSIRDAESVSYGSLKCVRCDFSGINLKALISHVSVVHRDVKGRWCPVCNGLFDDLKSHRREHDAGDLTCKFCSKSFTINRYLIQHLLGHTVGSKSKRKKKRRNSGTRSAVGTIGTKQRKKVGRYEGKETRRNSKLCSVCGKQFSNSSKLLTHLRSHTDETPFSCSICNKQLRTSSHLRQHENVHRESRRYQCSVCNKLFNQSSTLRTHLKLHGDKNHYCTLCEKAFCRLSDLKIHLRTHTGEKPFRCRVCDSAFVQKSHLTEHERKHLDVKPYKCVYCEKSFTQKSTLKSHIDIHLGVKSYQCNYCPYAARQSYVLKTHMKQHEREFGCTEEI